MGDMHFDMLSLGPARMDVFVGLPEEDITETCSIDKQRCMIELGFGEKIPIKSINFAVGGNTGNNAVGLARLGYKVAMAGTMGDHWVDSQAIEVLKKEGVNVDQVVQVKGAFGFGVIINYQGERTILSYYPEAECDFSLHSQEVTAGWVYLTTAGHNYECFYEEAVKWAKDKGAKIAFNPGSRQIKDGLEKIRYAFEASEIVFINREEAMKLLTIEKETEIEKLLNGIKDLGPKVVVITDGPAGTYSFDGQKILYMPIVDAPVVERTGAGDAFGSGFLAAVMAGKSVEEALRWGTCNSGSVLGFVGPQAGLLNREQMEEWLDRSKDVIPIEH